jgi:hypothetical protein
MHIDKAWGYKQAISGYFSVTPSERGAHFRDLITHNADVRSASLCTGTIDYCSSSDHDIEHLLTSFPQ